MKTLATILAILISAGANAQSLADSLLLYYPFSGNMEDVSGNGFNGIGNANLTADRFGNSENAYSFNGIDQFIDFPNNDELKPELPISISFWAKYNSADPTERVIFDTAWEQDASTGVWMTSQASSGRYAVAFGDGTSPIISTTTRRGYLSNSIIDTTTWHHIVISIVSATEMKIYVDCIESGGDYSGTGGSIAYSDANGSIGRHHLNIGYIPSYYFLGYLDDFRYWNREISISEIDSLCNDLVSSTQEIEFNRGPISIGPNPVQHTLHMNVSNNMILDGIVIFNMTGHVVYQGKYQSEISVRNLHSGMYILKVLKDHQVIDIFKFIKE